MEKRHIIRFAHERDYASFARHFGQQRKSLPLLRHIRPLRLIHGISCSLRSTKKISSASFIHSIEEDNRVQIHGFENRASIFASSNGGSSAEKLIIPWGVRHIRAPQTWTKSQGDKIRIGVIDTGADYSHPDLRRCLSRGINILNRHLFPLDDNGHGTHISGTIAAYTKRRGMVGVAPGALIHPVKAFDHQGGAFVSDIVSGIDWCVSSGIDIINMSFGMKTYSKALEAAVLNAYRAGVVIVASTGNEGKQAEVDYPARFRQVIAVGATTRKGRIAPFSNIGKQIDVYAPGEKIYSTWLRGKYHELSGTSMATSHVTGVVALMLAIKPGLRPLRIKTILRKHSRYLISSGKNVSCAKEIHAMRAVSALTKK